jgi:NDP-mannose synthase
MHKRAVILAGGKGARLRPYTVVLPKPLMPVGDYPVLEIIIRQLAFHGFEHITLTVNHQAEIIRAFFGDGSKWNIKIDYSYEDKPLSTMGPLQLIRDLPEDFLLMNGDVLTDLNYSDFFESHLQGGKIFTISAHERSETSEYGVLEKDNDSLLANFFEKPRRDYLVAMGINMVNRAILNYIPKNTYFGFDHLMHSLLENKEEVMIHKFEGYWLDIGRPDDYMQAIEDLEMLKEKIMPWE